MVMIPLPLATSAHAIGVSLISIIFGVRAAIFSETLVLITQFLILGKGGITVLPLNVIALGFVIPFASKFIFKILKRISINLALFLAGYLSVQFGALFVGFVLSLQFALDKSYFSIQPSILFPALLLPHLLFIGTAEGIYNIIGFKIINQIKKE